MKRLFTISLIVFAVIVMTALPALARELEIENFDAAIDVRKDASISVTETIDFQFTGSWQGIYRKIPSRYRTPMGFSFTLRIDSEEAFDGNGAPLKNEVSNEGYYRQIKAWVPGAEDAVRRVVLKYRVHNALQFFEDHDELYWNITGDEWDFPIKSASATITLPSGAAGVRATSYSGAYGSRGNDAEVSIAGHVVHIAMRQELSFREGLTGVVGWEKGLIDEPPWTAKVGAFIYANSPLFVPILIFFLMFRVWYTRGRDPRLNPITVRYEPPDGLTPAEAGTLIDNSADMRDITATIVDLAVRGYITIEDKEEAQLFGLMKKTEYVFHLKKPGHEWGELRKHERKLLNALFFDEARTEVSLSELENHFYTDIPVIKDHIFDQLIAHKYYRKRPDQVRGMYIVLGVMFGLIIMIIAFMMGDFYGIPPLTAVITGVLTAGIIIGFGIVMPARTKGGARALEGILGFEEFLQRVESDKYERVEMTPGLFERFLPYAMAFGVERRWAKAFDGIYNAQPNWYHGRTPVTAFSPHLFAASLGQMSSRASHAMSSAPRSHGGSSGFSSGGGFSGGGGGGGGGGGF